MAPDSIRPECPVDQIRRVGARLAIGMLITLRDQSAGPAPSSRSRWLRGREPGPSLPNKKASAAAWIVLVSGSRNGMIFPVICSSSADVPDNVPESRAWRRAASRMITWRASALYQITGHYHGLASQSPRQPPPRAYRLQEAAMGPSSYPPVILRPVSWTRARGPHQPLPLSGLLGLAPRKASPASDGCVQRNCCGGGSLIATGLSGLSRCDSPRMRTFSGSPSSTR
jgi:hypothetical protein